MKNTVPPNINPRKEMRYAMGKDYAKIFTFSLVNDKQVKKLLLPREKSA